MQCPQSADCPPLLAISRSCQHIHRHQAQLIDAPLPGSCRGALPSALCCRAGQCTRLRPPVGVRQLCGIRRQHLRQTAASDTGARHSQVPVSSRQLHNQLMVSMRP